MKNLVIRKGRAYNPYVADNILDASGFCFEENCHALEAVENILTRAAGTELLQASRGEHRALELDDRNSSDCLLEEQLYKYGQNIVAIDGSRGTGKTSTMLSISAALGKGRPYWMDAGNQISGVRISEVYPHIAASNFEILAPIDPTILSDGQTFLEIVLARIYNLIENAWCVQGRRTFARNKAAGGSLEFKKNEVLNCMECCLTGIHGILGKADVPHDTLDELHTISYGMQLKLLIFRLVEYSLDLLQELNGQEGRPQYLVIQLDDTDCQIHHGYQIVEDLRRYFSIPNVVVLMAADMDLMQTLLVKRFYADFNFEGLKDQVEKNPFYFIQLTAKKYMDKMFSPDHVVYLPKLDRILSDKSQELCVEYMIQTDRGGEINLLSEEAKACPDNIQAQILRLLYRKIGVVFVAEDGILHPIIPTRLRSFIQMLDLLSDMEDIPCVKDRKAKMIQKKVEVQDKNLNHFFDYFMKFWTVNKLTMFQVEALKRLRSAVSGQLFGIAWEILHVLFPANEDEWTPAGDCGYNALFGKLLQLEERPANRYICFAIRTCLTLRLHQMVLQQKLCKLKADCKNGNKFVFDFTGSNVELPDSLPLPPFRFSSRSLIWEDQSDTQSFEFPPSDRALLSTKKLFDTKEISNQIRNKFFTSKYDSRTDSYVYRFEFLNILFVFSKLDPEDGSIALYYDHLSQKQLYEYQQTLVLIACNLELHDALWKHFEKPIMSGKVSSNSAELMMDYVSNIDKGFLEMYDLIDSFIQSIDSVCDHAPLVTSCTKEMAELLFVSSKLPWGENEVPSDNNSAFRRAYVYLSDIWGGEDPEKLKKCLIDLLVCADKLNEDEMMIYDAVKAEFGPLRGKSWSGKGYYSSLCSTDSNLKQSLSLYLNVLRACAGLFGLKEMDLDDVSPLAGMRKKISISRLDSFCQTLCASHGLDFEDVKLQSKKKAGKK